METCGCFWYNGEQKKENFLTGLNCYRDNGNSGIFQVFMMQKRSFTGMVLMLQDLV